MSDTVQTKAADTEEPPRAEFTLDSAPAGSGKEARDLERGLRLFHYGVADDGADAAGFASPFRWNASADETPDATRLAEIRAACDAVLGKAADDDPMPIDSLGTAPVRAFLRVARHQSLARRAAFQDRVDDLCRQLRDLLRVDRAKSESRNPDALRDSMGTGATDFLNTDALSDVLGKWRGASSLSGERRDRLESALTELSAFSWDTIPLGVLVHDGALTHALPPDSGDWVEAVQPVPCAAALDLYEERAAQFSPVFRAVRIATLESEGRFDPVRHGPAVDGLDPAHFSSTERLLVPTVVAWDCVEGVASEEMPALMRVLLSDRPVHVLLRANPVPARAVVPGDSPSYYALEIGYLGVAHRKAFVAQSSVGSAEHLVQGMLQGLADMRPALHVLLTEAGPEPTLDSYALAVHARVHSHFRYDPQAGSTWAGRMEFGDNPAEDQDWPERDVPFERTDGESGSLRLPVTLADWAVGRAELVHEFRPIPDGCAAESLEPVGDYLALDEKAALEKVPFVWGVNPEGQLHRLAVTRRVVAACRERLDFWHTLQELAGVRSEYVLEAVRQTREELQQEAAAERDQLRAKHATELADARSTAVGEAMQTLSQRLLSLDLSGAAPMAATVPTTGAPAHPPVGASTESPSGATANGTAAVVSAEPWIDTPLCTSCNDCTNLNSLLFVYDPNKQAIIGDAHAGTFAQIVRAAEACPARCIHPGMPLNESEKGLDRLIERAKPFQ